MPSSSVRWLRNGYESANAAALLSAHAMAITRSTAQV
jgi:hypothetical protein